MQTHVIIGRNYHPGTQPAALVLAVYVQAPDKAEQAAEVFRRDGWRNRFGLRVDFDDIEVEEHDAAV